MLVKIGALCIVLGVLVPFVLTVRGMQQSFYLYVETNDKKLMAQSVERDLSFIMPVTEIGLYVVLLGFVLLGIAIVRALRKPRLGRAIESPT